MTHSDPPGYYRIAYKGESSPKIEMVKNLIDSYNIEPKYRLAIVELAKEIYCQILILNNKLSFHEYLNEYHLEAKKLEDILSVRNNNSKEQGPLKIFISNRSVNNKNDGSSLNVKSVELANMIEYSLSKLIEPIKAEIKEMSEAANGQFVPKRTIKEYKSQSYKSIKQLIHFLDKEVKMRKEKEYFILDLLKLLDSEFTTDKYKYSTIRRN